MTYLHIEPNRRRDPSNFCSTAAKYVEDALVEAGVLPGDGWGGVLGFTHYWRVQRGEAGLVVGLDDAPMPQSTLEEAWARNRS